MRARRQPGASDPARAILCEAGGGSAVPLERARDKLERTRGSPPLLPRLPLSLPPPPPRLSSHPRQGLARERGYGHSNTDVCRSQRPAGHITGGGTGGGGQQPGHPTNKRATGEGEKGGGRRPGCRQGPARSACGDGGSIRRAQGGYWNARGTDGNRLTLRSRHQRL